MPWNILATFHHFSIMFISLFRKQIILKKNLPLDLFIRGSIMKEPASDDHKSILNSSNYIPKGQQT